MKRLSTYILLWLISFCTYGQETTYYDYYKGINLAKSMIAEDDIESALNHYIEIFKKFDFIFARDCFNAFELSLKFKDNEKIFYLIQRCIKQGVEFDSFMTNNELDSFKQTDYWKELLISKDSLYISYQKNINIEIREEIIEMFNTDQELRERAYKARFNIFKRRKLMKQWSELSKVQVNRLIEITKGYGFPGEKLIGLDYSNMHPKISSKRLSAGMPIVIFIHFYSEPNANYNDLIKMNIKTGYIFNEHFAIISDFQNKYGKLFTEIVPPYSERFNPKESVNQINKNRYEIGLPNLEIQYKIQKNNLITPFWVHLY